MIASLRGDVVEKSANAAIIDVNGVGYEVLMPSTDLETMNIDQAVRVMTYFHVRENSQELYGFQSTGAKRLFELLISVNGVGPKGALAILDLGDEKQVKSAISSENIAFITGASGIGKKVAERITLDLKDKLGVFAEDPFVSSGSDDAHDALVALGYSAGQARGALKSIDPKHSTEERIRQALKVLSE